MLYTPSEPEEAAAEPELLSEPLEAAELVLAVPPMQAVRDRPMVRTRPAARSFFMFHFSFVNQFRGDPRSRSGPLRRRRSGRQVHSGRRHRDLHIQKRLRCLKQRSRFGILRISQMPRSGWLQLFQTSALHKEEAKKDVKKQARKKARHAAKEKSRGDQHIPILTHAADVHCGPLLPPDIPVFLWMYSI